MLYSQWRPHYIHPAIYYLSVSVMEKLMLGRKAGYTYGRLPSYYMANTETKSYSHSHLQEI